MGFFFSIGCLHTGQFFRHIPQICHSINAPSGNGCGQFQLRNHGEEPFSLFEGHKQRERSSLGQDRSRKTVKGRGILGGHASFDRGVPESSRTCSIAKFARPVFDVITGRPPSFLSSGIDKGTRRGGNGHTENACIRAGTMADSVFTRPAVLNRPPDLKGGDHSFRRPLLWPCQDPCRWSAVLPGNRLPPFKARLIQTAANQPSTTATRPARILPTTAGRSARTRWRAHFRRQWFQSLFRCAD